MPSEVGIRSKELVYSIYLYIKSADIAKPLIVSGVTAFIAAVLAFGWKTLYEERLPSDISKIISFDHFWSLSKAMSYERDGSESSPRCYFQYNSMTRIGNHHAKDLSLDKIRLAVLISNNREKIVALVGHPSEITEYPIEYLNDRTKKNDFIGVPVRTPLNIKNSKPSLYEFEFALTGAIYNEKKELVAADLCKLINDEQKFMKAAFSKASVTDGYKFQIDIEINGKNFMLHDNRGVLYVGQELKIR